MSTSSTIAAAAERSGLSAHTLRCSAPEQLRALDEAFPPGGTAGDRYADMAAVEL